MFLKGISLEFGNLDFLRFFVFSKLFKVEGTKREFKDWLLTSVEKEI